MRVLKLLGWTLLASCSREPSASPRVEPLHVAPAASRPTSPCDRINERQRGAHSFRRCTWTDDGAIGVVAEPSSEAFRIVFEAQNGTSVASAPLGLMNAQAEDLVVARPPPGRVAPVTFARYRDHLEPAPLGEALPVQTPQFFASVFGAPSPSRPCLWTGLEEVEPKLHRLSFRLPDLRWQQGVAYGGQTERSLRGVEAHVFLGERYQLEKDSDLLQAVVAACNEAPTLDWAKPEQLWAAAQCHRVRGESVAATLKHVETRCGALARESLPSVKALSELRQRERGGVAIARREVALMSERLDSTSPPSVCFSEDPLWDVDYTARGRPFSLPTVVLGPAWREGLDAMGTWPR